MKKTIRLHLPKQRSRGVCDEKQVQDCYVEPVHPRLDVRMVSRMRLLSQQTPFLHASGCCDEAGPTPCEIHFWPATKKLLHFTGLVSHNRHTNLMAAHREKARTSPQGGQRWTLFALTLAFDFCSVLIAPHRGLRTVSFFRIIELSSIGGVGNAGYLRTQSTMVHQ